MALWFLHQRAQRTQPQLSICLCVCLFFILLMLPITSIPGSYSRLQNFLVWIFFPSDCVLCSLLGSKAQRVQGGEEREEMAGPRRKLGKPREEGRT